jgi:hypothetical protein
MMNAPWTVQHEQWGGGRSRTADQGKSALVELRDTPKATMNQLADFYYCISLLKIVRTVSYRLYTIMRYLW